MSKEDPVTHGWTDFNGQARKFHYVPADDSRALCGKWGLSPFVAQAREHARFDADTGKASPDDCATCRRKLDATRPRHFDVLDPIGDGQDDRGEK